MAKNKTNSTGEKLNYKQTILTGFGFLATSIAWAIYDPYITKILNKLLTSSATITEWSNMLVEKIPFITKFAEAQGENVALAGGGFTLVPLFIGIIMTFDNIFGVIFQPTFGRLSDECHSKLGKRRPFIVFGAPISALLFFIIPLVFLKTGSLPLTMACIILFVFTMSLWRAPVVALMPDLTPPALRSEGNAVINLMGGLGSAIGMVAGTLAIVLCTVFSGVTKEQIVADETLSFPYVFAIGALIMIAGMLVLLFFVKEPDSRIKLQGDMNAYADAKSKKKAEKEALRAAKKEEKAARKAIKLSPAERRSLIFMLLCLFFLFCGANAITTFFSLFAQEILHKITSEATILMLIFAVVAAVAALPAGKMGKKFGRKKTITAGLAVFLAAFIVFFGVFVAMLGGKNLTIGNYVDVNNAYSTINNQINEYNSELSEKADDEGVELAAKDMVDMSTYIEYRLALESEADVSAYESCVAFDEYLTQYSEATKQTAIANGADEASLSDVYSGIVSVANDILGCETENFGTALQALSESVADVTAILNVLIYPVLILGGAANMFITVNTLPLVLEIGGVEKVGTFTGYYYTATFSAQIASPIIYGFIRMFAGTYMSLFYYSPVVFLIAVVMLFFVKHGEAIPDNVLKEAAQDD